MNKTIYVREEDKAVFDKAEKLYDGSLSALITNLLYEYVAKEELKLKGFEMIEIKKGKQTNLPKGKSKIGEVSKKKFYGIELFSGKRNDQVIYIYLTRKGKIVYYTERHNLVPPHRLYDFHIYDSLEEFRNSSSAKELLSDWMIEEAEDRLKNLKKEWDEDVEFLDI